MTLQEFKASIAKKCSQVKNELIITVEDIKQMANQQKKEKMDELKNVHQNLKKDPNTQSHVQDSNLTGHPVRSNLLNISLESIANYNYQEKI